MWWKLKKVDAHVEIHLFVIVDVQLFVGIDRHQQRANVGLKEPVKTIMLTVEMLLLTAGFKKSFLKLT